MSHCPSHRADQRWPWPLVALLALWGSCASGCTEPNPLFVSDPAELDGGVSPARDARSAGDAAVGDGALPDLPRAGAEVAGPVDAPPGPPADGARDIAADVAAADGPAPVTDARPVDAVRDLLPDLTADAAPSPGSCLPWWTQAYRQRRRLSMNAGTAPVPAGTWASYAFDHRAMVAAGGSLASGADVRVAYWDGGTWVDQEYFLDEASRWGAVDTTIWFRVGGPLAGGEIDQRHFLYHGNPAAPAPLPASETLILRALQTGTARSAADGVLRVTIAPVRNAARAFLMFQTRSLGAKPGDATLRGVLATASTLEFHRRTDSMPAPAIDIRWYVAEFVSGVRVQRGELVQTAAPADVPLAQVLAQRSFALWSRTPMGQDLDWGASAAVVMDVFGPTTLQLRADATGGGQKIAWQVIELINEGWVQSNPPATLLGGEQTVAVPLSRAASLGSSIVLTSATGPGGGVDVGSRLLRAGLSDSRTLQIAREASGGADDLTEIAWQVIEFPGHVRAQSGLAAFAPAAGLVRSTLITAVDPARTLALATGQMGGGESTGSTTLATAGTLGVCSATLTVSGSQVLAERNVTTANCNLAWSVLEFPRTLRAADVGPRETVPGPSCRDR